MAKKAKKVSTGAAQNLLECLSFLSLAQHKEGESYKLHCSIANGMGYAFDGVIACGMPIKDSLDAQPRTDMLLKALARCGDTLSITEIDDQLAIVSGGFRVKVPCDPTPLVYVQPDSPSVAIQGRLAASLAILAGLPEEDEPRLVGRSILLQAGSCAASRRGHVIMEAWHGYDISHSINLPINSVKGILKAGKEITAIGYSTSSFTAHFADGSWIRTQLDEGNWPAYQKVFDSDASYQPIPDTLFTAIKTVKEFSTDERIRLRDSQVQTHNDEAQGSVYECQGCKGDVTYKTEYLLMLEELQPIADFLMPNGCLFRGKKDGISVRGAIARVTGEGV